MAPKKQVKMSLNDFLVDSTYGSWADEMEEFPTAPAPKAGSAEMGTALSRAPDRSERQYPHREELPLPTAPPYTAFVGNLPFDITEANLGSHFRGADIKSVKIIKDRDEKPKGFGYVEFSTLDGLKSGLSLSNSQLAGRTIRVSVADPPKEREGRSAFGDRGGSGFGGPSTSAADEDRQWRREGPLPPRDDDRRGGHDRGSSGFGRSGGRFGSDSVGRFSDDGGERGGFGKSREPPPSIAEEISDWRSTMKPTAPPPLSASSDRPRFGFGGGSGGGGSSEGGMKRRGSGFNTPSRGEFESPKVGPADMEGEWTRSSKFRPAEHETDRVEGGGRPFGRKFGDRFGEGHDASDDIGDWRSAPRKGLSSSSSGPGTPGGLGRGSSMEKSPNASGLPTRRKLDLLPRTNDGNTPLGSPKSGEATPASATSAKPNPFGAAKPIDAAAREREIEEKMERTKLASTPLQQNASLAFSRSSSRPTSRQGSRQGSPTRSPSSKHSALGLGGMGPNTGSSASPSDPPKILSRPQGGVTQGRGGYGHGRAGSVGISPKWGHSDSGDNWRRAGANASNANTYTIPEGAPAPVPAEKQPDRRASVVRPSFSFANAASGGTRSTATPPPGSKPLATTTDSGEGKE